MYLQPLRPMAVSSIPAKGHILIVILVSCVGNKNNRGFCKQRQVFAKERVFKIDKPTLFENHKKTPSTLLG